ncbi:hypothetical protein LOD99_3743 [Oopsacas minuta]|uniref:Alpha/beta hydrolase fold-5 domain-containing protein n=1 Tax=Oopsacas minuta TaxID=111878 RepID=A0AAV7JW13_9METZ|nr:hypothetical protein LOD99_3743 [Oopsacas minuta]
MAELNGFEIGLILLLLFITTYNCIILPPKHTGTNQALIFIQGANLPADKYTDLLKEVQSRATSALWIAIPEFTLNMPNPLEIQEKIENMKEEIAKHVKVEKYFYAGHSLGGYMLSEFVRKNSKDLSAIILMGSFLTRDVTRLSWPDGEYIIDYPVNVLTVGGELDGMCRVTRMAEAYYKQQVNVKMAKQKDKFPLVIIGGINHAQYFSGEPNSFIQKNDLKSEITKLDGFNIISQVIVEYIENYEDLDSSQILKTLREWTEEFIAPLITAFHMEGYYQFKPACYNKSLENANINTCGHGSPWSNRGQIIMGGLNATKLRNVSLQNDDNFHRVYTVTPVHLPIVNNTCSGDIPCILHSITVSENYYERFDNVLDTGFYAESALEIKCKMSSRQRIWEKAGLKDVNFNKTDLGDICKAINQVSLDYSKSITAKRTLARYNIKGVPFVMGPDLGPYNEGPLWIWHYMNYKAVNRDGKNEIFVQSPMMRTSTDYPIASARGFHYCKLLSPARVLEHIYIDSLRTED